MYAYALQEEDSTLVNMERMKLFQRVATAEEGAKQAWKIYRIEQTSEKETLQTKLETLNEQVQRFEEWHRLVVDNAQQTPTGEATSHGSQEETVVVNREKHMQLKKNFLLLTEKNMKIEKSHQQLLEKLED